MLTYAEQLAAEEERSAAEAAAAADKALIYADVCWRMRMLTYADVF